MTTATRPADLAAEREDLALYIINTSSIYFRHVVPHVKYVAKLGDKAGNHTLGGWMHIVEIGFAAYIAEFGRGSLPRALRDDRDERAAVAEYLIAHYADLLETARRGEL